MTEARFGAQMSYPVEMENDAKYMEYMKRRARHTIGMELADYILRQDVPVVARIRESTEDETQWTPNGLWGNKIYRLIVDLNLVEVMKLRMMELPPFEFVSHHKNGTVVEWQCAYCGQVNLVVEHIECRKCGAPRKAIR